MTNKKRVIMRKETPKYKIGLSRFVVGLTSWLSSPLQKSHKFNTFSFISVFFIILGSTNDQAYHKSISRNAF